MDTVLIVGGAVGAGWVLGLVTALIVWGVNEDREAEGSWYVDCFVHGCPWHGRMEHQHAEHEDHVCYGDMCPHFPEYLG